MDFGIGSPYCLNRSFAWYSNSRTSPARAALYD
jgi:hypothetical protein